MKIKDVISALAALSQETRLAIFRLLVETGPEGLPVGQIAEMLKLANATLSFHLKELTNAGLTVAAPNGRSIIYSANFKTMGNVVNYLTENCCVGATCATTVACKPSSRKPANTVSKTATRKIT
jgi:ArsR family transcriptional regulator, arsenate/arsenite/antimonite-responsive transcriptional repressor